MTIYKTLRLGRLVVAEDFTVGESGAVAGRSLSLAGTGAMPSRTRAQLEYHREDVLNMAGELIPVIFTEKRNLNGVYQVDSASSAITNWDDTIVVMDWKMALNRVGSFSETDFESRLSGSITRTNDFTATGKRWHAPPVGTKTYWSGSTIPISVARVGSEGSLSIYQNLAQGINPRWGVPIDNFEKGRVRFIDQNGFERHGTSFETSPGNWELSNSLIKVNPGTAGNFLDTSAWIGTTFNSPKTWDLQYGTGPAVSLGICDYVTVLSNNYHAVTIRLVKDLLPGRMMVDLTLRRGASFVEVYVQHEYATTLTLKRFTVTAGTSSPGYIAATAADANGMKSIVGSARTFTADAPNHSISKASTPTLDAFIGVAMDTAAGNLPADLYQQYLGSPAELVRGVGR